MNALRDKAAIVGIGETDYSKNSGRTELGLAVEAIKAALDDAGLEASDVDGLVRYEMDSVDEVALTSHLGLNNLRWMSHTGYGGTGGNAVIAQRSIRLSDLWDCASALHVKVENDRYARAA